MNKETFIKQCEKYGDTEKCITIRTKDKIYTIEKRILNKWESSLLGYITYNDIYSIANDVYKYITNGLKENIEDIY